MALFAYHVELRTPMTLSNHSSNHLMPSDYEISPYSCMHCSMHWCSTPETFGGDAMLVFIACWLKILVQCGSIASRRIGWTPVYNQLLLTEVPHEAELTYTVANNLTYSCTGHNRFATQLQSQIKLCSVTD